MNRSALVSALVLGTAVLATGVAHAGINAERARECKSIVLENSEFRHLPMAAVSVSKHNDGIKWVINWDGQHAKGVCVYKHKQFKKLKIKKHLKTHKKHQGSDGYEGRYGGFYYDRHIGQWRDPDGEVCHTCTPENGFPYGGG